MTACVLTPYPNRKLIAEAAKQYPARIVPFGYVDLDAPDVVQQVEELHRSTTAALASSSSSRDLTRTPRICRFTN